MTPSGSHSRNAKKSYSRKPARALLPGRTFLIVTEGRKTEPNYFRALRDRLRLATANVVIVHPEGTDPVTLVGEAIRLRDAQAKLAKGGTGVAYDDVWVVFDLEKPHDERRRLAEEARTTKGAKGIRFADSDPCFEYWLLLHEEYTTAPCVDCAAVVSRLSKHWGSYAKGQILPSTVIDRVPTAVTHAARCRDHHAASGGDGNPSTRVDHLVRALNAATRPHFAFDLS
jgi:hypothetical protein